MFTNDFPALPDFISRSYPFDRRVYQIEAGRYRGRKIHLVDHGPRTARPVMLLHGNPMWSFLWRKVIARLGDFRIIAPDLLGLGLSDKLPKINDHALVDHGAALAELVQALELEGLIVFGQDWGGPMTTSTCHRVPERIAGALFANTAVVIPEIPRGTTFHKFARTPIVSDLAFRVFGFPLPTLHRVQANKASIKGEVAAAYRWPLRRMRERIAPLALARMVPDAPGHPSVAELKRGEEWLLGFKGPLSLVWGERDPILGRALKRHQDRLPHATVQTCVAGHFLQEEVPELLADAVRAVAARIEVS